MSNWEKLSNKAAFLRLIKAMKIENPILTQIGFPAIFLQWYSSLSYNYNEIELTISLPVRSREIHLDRISSAVYLTNSEEVRYNNTLITLQRN